MLGRRKTQIRQRHQDKAQFMKWSIQIEIVQDRQIHIDLPLSTKQNINYIYINILINFINGKCKVNIG